MSFIFHMAVKLFDNDIFLINKSSDCPRPSNESACRKCVSQVLSKTYFIFCYILTQEVKGEYLASG